MRWWFGTIVVAGLAGCSTPAEQAQALLRAGRNAQAVELLDQSLRERPDDEHARVTRRRAEQTLAAEWVVQIERERAAGRVDAARATLERLRALAPTHPRLAGLEAELDAMALRDRQLAQVRQALAAGDLDAARTLLAPLRRAAPQDPMLGGLQRQLDLATPPAAPATDTVPRLGPAFQRPVSLEFRDAPLRTVFESLARTTAINFVFDKDVRGDAKVTLVLRDVLLDEAVRLVLATQGLERKLLNDNTLLIYPATQAKQREHQELVTRTFYMANADARGIQAMLKTIAKTRDIHVDERLNTLTVRDTPQAVALAAHLVAGADLPESEVLLEVEVLEIASQQLDDMGLRWPGSVSFGLPPVGGLDAPGAALLNQHRSFRGWIGNPAVVATLHGTAGTSSLIANPSIRARNREKARIQVGERLPVFTTAAVANVQALSTTVTYVDVGLKLEVEPIVQLGGDVTMHIALEVTNFISRIVGPQGSSAYQLGTRNATTSIRLRDGETQILAGLIRNDDRRAADGVPGLASLPIAGRLFGVQSNDINKTEVVLLITPRVLRNVTPPAMAATDRVAGTDLSPGLPALRLRPQARVALAPSTTPGAAPPPEPEPAQAAAPVSNTVALQLESSGAAAPGETAAVTLRHASPARVSGTLVFDGQRLQLEGGGDGRADFTLEANGQRAFVFRVRPNAAIGPVEISPSGVVAVGPDGVELPVRLEGQASVTVKERGK